MHASLNSSPQAPLESAYASSSVFSLDVQSLNLGLLRQTLYPNKSPSDFLSPKPGTTPNVHEPIIQIKFSPENNTTTTNESYSVDNCFQVNNSDLLGRMLRNNTSMSHPVTTRGSPRRRDLSCEKETSSGQVNHIHLLEYEEFTPEKEPSIDEGGIEKPLETLDLPSNKDRVIKLNEVQQQSDKKKATRRSIKERERQDSDIHCKVLSDSSTKEQNDGKGPMLSERNYKPKGVLELENSSGRRNKKRGKERTETSTENSEGSPIVNKDRQVLLKETELLRNILREKEKLLGKSKKSSEQYELAKINEDINKENIILKADLTKMAEAYKGKTAEANQLREINHNQRENILKLEEKCIKMEKINFNLEKVKKNKDEEIKTLEEEVQSLRNKKLKYKEDFQILQRDYEELKFKYESVYKTLTQEKPIYQSAEKVKSYKGKIMNLKSLIKGQQDTIASKDNAIVNLLGKLEEIASYSSYKDLEINRLKEEVLTLSEELKAIKSVKARVKTKSSDECHTKISSREHLTEISAAESSRSGTKKTKKTRSKHIDLETGFTSKRSTSTQDSCLQAVNQISSVRGSQRPYDKNTIPPDFRKTEKLRVRDNSERETSIERNNKTIKRENKSKPEGSGHKEGRATHLNIGQVDQLKFYEAFYSKRTDSETPSIGPTSARGERRSKDSYIKNMMTNESHNGNITTDRLKTLHINKHILFNEGSSKPPRERQALSQEKERDIKINNFLQNYKRGSSPPSEEHNSQRGTKNSSKRPSNIDRDYFDPYDIGAVNTKPPLTHIPLSATNSNFDSKRDIMSAKSARETVFRKINQTGKEGKSYTDDLSHLREAKGTPLSATTDSSKSSLLNAVKIERGSKSGSKKKPSSGKKENSTIKMKNNII